MPADKWNVFDFFISDTLIVGFLLFNQFVGIVLNAMGEARSADRAKPRPTIC